MKVQGSIFSYEQYVSWVAQLVAEGKTSGNKQTPGLIAFTPLNLRRMLRLNKTLQINDALSTELRCLKENQTWYVIAEAWCGDCAQNLPVIAEIARLAGGKIDLRIILRDENPEWMEKYPTNGSKSIPKLIAFNAIGEELFTWGARPKEAQELLLAWKQFPGDKSWDSFEKDLHTWYAKNKSEAIQDEFQLILSDCNKTTGVHSTDLLKPETAIVHRQ